MRGFMIPVVLVMLCGLTGCLISTQVGERHHVNAPYPDEMEFHFDTLFNKFILIVRSAGLMLLSYWVLTARRKGEANLIIWALAVVPVIGCGWLLYSDVPTVFGYRIEIGRSELRLTIPQQPEQVIPWGEIALIRAGEKDLKVKYGVVEKGITWDAGWDGVTLTLADGRMHEINLRPLSVEHRGIVAKMIGRKAQLGVKKYVDRN